MTRSDFDSTIQLVDVDCGRGGQTLIESINVVFERGVITGLVGPNGIGKSTLMSTIIGDVRPISGKITFGNMPVRNLPQRSRVFGVTIESHGLPKDMSVGGIIRYWADIHGISKSRMNELCESLKVDSFFKRRIKKLSTGMRRRVELVIALLPDPGVVILDEPFNGLDIDGVDELRELIRKLRDNKKVVLLTTHTMSELDQLAEKLYAVHNKKLVELQFNPGELGSSEAAYRRLREENKGK